MAQLSDHDKVLVSIVERLGQQHWTELHLDSLTPGDIIVPITVPPHPHFQEYLVIESIGKIIHYKLIGHYSGDCIGWSAQQNACSPEKFQDCSSPLLHVYRDNCFVCGLKNEA